MGIQTYCIDLHRLAIVGSQICKILREFELVAVQGHPRWLILVPIDDAYATSC